MKRKELILRIIGFTTCMVLLLLIPFMTVQIRNILWAVTMIFLVSRLLYMIYNAVKHKNKTKE